MSLFSSESHVFVHHRLAGSGSRSHLLASSIRSRGICSIFSFECDMIQKLSSCISDALLPFRCPKRVHFLFLIHSSSTLAKIWVVIFCHKCGASTLRCHRHLLKQKQLSTSPDISGRRTAISHPCA